MSGISTLGWVHTLGSLPAIPAALWMLARHGRIVPRSTAGAVYLVSMLIGVATIPLVAHQSVSNAIAAVTLLLLLVGYGAARLSTGSRAGRYVETISLTATVFLLILPSISETLRRVPNGHPLVADPKSPVLLAVMGSLLVLLVVGLAAQIVRLRARGAGA